MAKKKPKEKKEIPIPKSQIKDENKLLRNFLLGILGVALVFILIWVIIDASKEFEYKGIEFEVRKMGSLVLYHTQVPIYYKGEKTVYNFYLRNDPRVLERNVDFDGEFVMRKAVVFNSTSDFSCQGYGAIATNNLKQLYALSDVEILSSKGAECDPEGRYVYIEVNRANSTYIEQTDETCYEINIKDCEILKGMERFMVEALVKVNDMLS